jgi:hypothetical protein
MFISLKSEGVKVMAYKMVGKHECSEKRHCNNYHNIELCCEQSTSGAVGQMNGGLATQFEEAVASDYSESAIATYF